MQDTQCDELPDYCSTAEQPPRLHLGEQAALLVSQAALSVGQLHSVMMRAATARRSAAGKAVDSCCTQSGLRQPI